MKYVIVYKNGCEVANLGCEVVDHVDLQGNGKAISAGKCRIGWNREKNQMEVSVWGESITLKNKKGNNLAARPEDADIILRTIQFE